MKREFRLAEGFRTTGKEKVSVPFNVKNLSQGSHKLDCHVYIEGEKEDTIEVEVIKRPRSENAVKIDRASGGLIVDGLPWFPFGFYAYSPVQPHLFEEEVVRRRLSMELLSKGTAWFDLMQVVPVSND